MCFGSFKSDYLVFTWFFFSKIFLIKPLLCQKILDDFKSGRASHAPFWIQMKGKFIKIEYFALRGEDGEYLGTLEVSQDLSGNRALEGERRILEYANDKEESNG